MSERFLKFIPSDEAMCLVKNHPNAFALLTVIAERARRKNGQPDGFLVGDALISSSDLALGMSRQNFRTALDKLVELGQLKIISNGKKNKEFLKMIENPTIKVTIKGMLVNLCKSTIWDINSEEGNHQSNQHFASDQPTTNQQTGVSHIVERKKKKELKEDHPQTPSGASGLLSDDSSSKKEIEICSGVFLSEVDLEKCVAIKGNLEAVKYAIEQIQENPNRKAKIKDWPKALENWNVEEDPKVLAEKNTELAKRICSKFRDFVLGRSRRCSMYWDSNLCKQGVLFEHVSVYQDPIFIPLSDGEFEQKCKKIVGEV